MNQNAINHVYKALNSTEFNRGYLVGALQPTAVGAIDIEANRVGHRVTTQIEKGLSPRLERTLERRGDDRVLADILMAWKKGYSVKETSRALGVPRSLVQELHRTFHLPPILIKPSTPAAVADLEYLLRTEHRDKKTPLSRRLRGDYSCEEPLTVMMDLTPSGPLHLAKVFAIAGGAFKVSQIAKKAGIYNIEYTLGFDDLHAISRGHSKEEVTKRELEVRRFLLEMHEELGIAVRLQRYSELEQTEEFRTAVEFASTRGLMSTTNEHGLPGIRLGFLEDDGKVYFPEINLCGVNYLREERAIVPVNIISLMALRDSCLQPDIHILGGNQVDASKIHANYKFVGEKKPFIYQTGTVYGEDGAEMHTAKDNTVPIDLLREHLDWVREVAEMSGAPCSTIGRVEYGKFLD